jgi:hypothetical protein
MDGREIPYLLFLCGFGIWSFLWGFNRFRRKRLIENIPTSTVRGLAMGLVELIGKAKIKQCLNGPLSGMDCVFYRYLVERYQQSGRSSRWVKITYGDSSYCPFYLDDGTGEVLVTPHRAELFMPVDYEFTTGFGRSLPDNLVQFMENNNLSYRTFLGTQKLRFKEWFIYPGEEVYVLGTAKKSENFQTERNQRLVERLQKLKHDPTKMVDLDSNKDGIISNEEWDLARDKVEQELLEENLKSAQSQELTDVVIGKGDAEKVFIISDYSQKDLTKSLFWKSILGIYGGSALALVSLLFLLIRFGILSF